MKLQLLYQCLKGSNKISKLGYKEPLNEFIDCCMNPMKRVVIRKYLPNELLSENFG